MRTGTYLFMIVGIMMLFNLSGSASLAGYVLTYLNIVENPAGISLTELFLTSAGILAGIGVASTLIVGLYTKSSPESFLLVGYTSILLLFIGDLVSIVVYANATDSGNWATYLIGLICMPVIVGYIHSVLSWWGGKSG